MRRDSAGIDRPSSIAAALTVPWRATSRKASMLLRGGRRDISTGDDDMGGADTPEFCAVRHRLTVGRGRKSGTTTYVSHSDLFEGDAPWPKRSEEHTSELQSLMRNSYAVF